MPFRTIDRMRDFIHERMIALAGLVAALAVGVWVALDQATDGGLVDAGAVWWVPYLVFMTAFGYDTLRTRAGRWDRALVAIETGAASLTYLVDPSVGWTGVLMVVSASSGAFTLSSIWLSTQLGAQTAVAGIGQIASGGTAADAGLAVVAFGAFQIFAVLVVRAERSEAEARADLEAANLELRAASAMLAQSSQLSERLRIARELHDLIGHQLTALSIELEVASHQIEGRGLEHVQRARDTATALLGNVREVVGDLRDSGSAMSEPLHGIVNGLPGLEVDLKVVEKAPVPEETAIAVIRCVQELATNTLKHARAGRLWIEVRSGPEGVTVHAEDDGRGRAEVVEGHGLTGMRERIEGLGGQLKLNGRPGLGMRVEARIPSS